MVNFFQRFLQGDNPSGHDPPGHITNPGVKCPVCTALAEEAKQERRAFVEYRNGGSNKWSDDHSA